MAALASDWLRHFRLLSSLLKLLNWIQQNLTGSKILTSSIKFVFFRLIEKTRWPPWPLIGRDIFDFFTETVERNSTKLDRKQGINVLYQVCVFFWPIGKTRCLPGLWLAETFSTCSLKQLNGVQGNFTGSKISTSSTKFVFSGRLEKQDGPPVWSVKKWQIVLRCKICGPLGPLLPYADLKLICPVLNSPTLPIFLHNHLNVIQLAQFKIRPQVKGQK